MKFLRLMLVLALACLMLPALGRGQEKQNRLILKDGTYQLITKYEIKGDRVRYFSAERDDWEELPKNLVDWDATAKWALAHQPGAKPAPGSPEAAQAAELDREEQADRAEREAQMPLVAPGLRLPDEDGVWALDTYQGQPELAMLQQSSGDVNRQTGHNLLRGALNPLGGMKQRIQMEGAHAQVQLHVDRPVLYVSLSGDEAPLDGSETLTVDTHGASSVKEKDSFSSPKSRYVILRVQSNARKNFRVISGVRISMTGRVSQTADVIPATSQVLPGGHWMKVTPSEPLTIGEYALMEVLGPGEINLSVWDFGVNPQQPENPNTIQPIQGGQGAF